MSLCRLCLKELDYIDFSVELKYCQAFNNNHARLNMFVEICKQFSLEVVENNLMHKICASCDTALLSTAVFVENCFKSNEYFKSQAYKDILYDFNGHKEIQLDLNDVNSSQTEKSNKSSFYLKFIKTNSSENHVGNYHSQELEKETILNGEKSTSNEFFEGYRCHHCEEVFQNKQLLRSHIKRHEKLFICHCGKGFKHQFRFNKHCSSIHSTENSRLKCSECNKIFKSANSLDYHINIHRNIKPFYCSSCDESFFSPNSLKIHQRLAHSITKNDSGKQQFLCDNCGVSFSRRYHLKRHRIIRHTNPPLAFPCEICGKAFVDQSRLRAHLLIHTDQRDFKCSECNRAFRTQSARQSHTSRVHLNLRPFPCPTCAKAFKSKSHLKKHIRTHTGEKPFSCPFCPYISAEHSNLKKHTKLHHRQ